MPPCRPLGGTHLSALTGSQAAWRRMQEKRLCLFPPCCHAHKLHDDASGRLAGCWPRDSQTTASSLLTSTLISHFLLFSVSLIFSLPIALFHRQDHVNSVYAVNLLWIYLLELLPKARKIIHVIKDVLQSFINIILDYNKITDTHKNH